MKSARTLGRILAAAVVMLGLLLVGGPAYAGTASITWTNPSTNVDGSPIGTITGTRIEYGTCNGGSTFGTKAGERLVTAGTSATLSLSPGTWCVRAYTQTAAGESAPSNAVQAVIAAPLPNPPTLSTTVVVAGSSMQPAYGITAAGAQGALVGLVDVGRECAGPVVFTYRGAGFRRVDPGAVRWWTGVKPTTAVAAACG